MTWWTTAAGLLAVLGGAVCRAAEGTEPVVDFNREVRPILAKNCFPCHGPDGAQRQAGLRLDRRESAVKKPRRGLPAVTAGDPTKSEIIARVSAKDETERMPPKESGERLTPEQVATLERWVRQGATYAEHWAFVPPRRPPLPAVRDPSWTRNPVDAFIRARLENEGLRPSPEADALPLLRRVSLDLRGLPPTPEEVEQFAQDTRPGAYERAVDRFLADPAFGERWARLWLDLARYADSAGYGSDPLRPNMWRYRDWVVDAFNRNLPYDQFTVWQLAGDLLPGATVGQRLATAFHRNTMTNTEGGTDDEEFRVAAVKDRVDTTLQVWMGLTMGCAKCHNHKFDPISQKEYYQAFAVFNQTADADRPDEQPLMPAPTAQQQEQARRLDEQIAELTRRLDADTPELAAGRRKWEAGLHSDPKWRPLEPESFQSEAGATFEKVADGSIRVAGPAGNDVYTMTVRSDLAGVTAFRLEAIPDASLPNVGAGRAADGNFVLSRFAVSAAPAGQEAQGIPGRLVRIELPGKGRILSLAEVEVLGDGGNVARGGEASQSSTDYDGPARLAIDGNTNGNYFEAKSTTHTRTERAPWWEVKLPRTVAIDRVRVWNRTDGDVGGRLANFRVQVLDEARKVVWQEEVAEPPKPSRELSLSGRQPVTLAKAWADFAQDQFPVTAALKQPAATQSGWAVAPRQKEPHTAVFVAAPPVGAASGTLFTFRLEHRFKTPGYTLGRFRLSATTDATVVKRAEVPADVLAVVDTLAERRSAEQRQKLAAHYRTLAPELKPIREEIAKLEKSRPKFPTLPVMAELPAIQRRVTHLMNKGNFLDKGDKVEPALPSAFHPLPPGAEPNRLGLAQWLVSPDNPLTARVAVNRLWAQVFGSGLVETEEDFGTQGVLPSDPELLDWLATEHVRLGWDTKAFLRLLVTSAAYRQSSKVTPESLAKDPRNRLLSRAPRFRLEAEMVRDQALALSGLLVRRVGGPSVYPPQPPGLWQAAFNGERTWATSTGPDRYRRGLYTFWRRTVPYPSMATFDAPSRETCAVRRVRTNTPLQAFVTLNDPVYVEAAQALARRVVREGGATVAERVRFALRLCLCREPNPEQVKGVVRLFAHELEHYRQHPQDAAALATEPLGPLPAGMEPADLAAWTVVANVLLNLDGVMTKG